MDQAYHMPKPGALRKALIYSGRMDPRGDLERIARAALASVDPRALVARSLRIEGARLRVETPDAHARLDLSRFRRIVVLGFGKSAAPMARAVEEALGPRIDTGLIVVKPGCESTLERIRQIPGGHPVPDERSLRAAAEIAALADGADAQTLVITLISGGGSSLIAAPLAMDGGGRPRPGMAERPTLVGGPVEVGLADIQETTRKLLACGAAIGEINCIRRHLLLLAGGRLAGRIAPGCSLGLVLSDVVGNDLQSIASGPTCPDSSTFADALGVIEGYSIGGDLPDPVMEFLRAGAAGRVPETLKPDAPGISSASNVIVGTNLLALKEAALTAERLGYHPMILTSHLTGEARVAAGVIAAVARDVGARDVGARGVPCARPACILTGGETTVTVRGDGTGGRNQEMAVAFLREMEKDPGAFSRTHFLSFGTDGEDGPTEAAGGFALPSFVEASRAFGIRTADFLARNDSHACLARLGGLFVTGPTGTNVCDLQIALVL